MEWLVLVSIISLNNSYYANLQLERKGRETETALLKVLEKYILQFKTRTRFRKDWYAKIKIYFAIWPFPSAKFIKVMSMTLN